MLKKLQDAGFHLKLEKCQFAVHSLEFVGYHVSKEGIKPSESNVKCLLEAPTPTNVAELQSYLGYINYYDRFFPNKATMFSSLYELLCEGTTWRWTDREENYVKYIKKVMSSRPVLMHYDSILPIVLSCDASPYGVGVVLSCICENNQECPTACASQTLTGSEKNYAQINKEALSVIFGVQKFRMHLAGRFFKIITDHKPLVGIFRPGKTISDATSPRMLLWTLMLSNYDYDIIHHPGKLHGNVIFLVVSQ